jgi:hypothetical protein
MGLGHCPLTEAAFEPLDALSYRFEMKRVAGDWIDTLVQREANEIYPSPGDPPPPTR